MIEVECPYCGRQAHLVDSAQIYGKSYGKVWACLPCKAWVGVHRDSGNLPLGTLANAETRRARRMAHRSFDPLWKSITARGLSKNKARSRAYAWLAKHLGIPREDCHIGLFDLKTCVKVIEICVRESYNPQKEETGHGGNDLPTPAREDPTTSGASVA